MKELLKFPGPFPPQGANLLSLLGWAVGPGKLRDSFLSFPLVTTIVIPFQGPQSRPWNILRWFLKKENGNPL